MEEELKTKYKFKCVLFELLKSDFMVSDDTVLEKLITHLSDKDKGSQLLDVPLCTAWTQSVVLSWHQGKTSAPIVSFALRLCAIILEDENNFLSIQKATAKTESLNPEVKSDNDSVFLQLLQELCVKTTRTASNFSVKSAIIQLLASYLKHLNGRNWIMSSGLWREVHKMSLNDSSVYVLRAARRFLSNLLNILPPTHEAATASVLESILEPFLSVSSFSEAPANISRITRTLSLISEVLENSFKTSDPVTNKIGSLVPRILMKPECNLLAKSLEALKATKSEEMEELLSKIAAFMYILNIVMDGKKSESSEIKKACIQILDICNELINKGSVENVLKLCGICHTNWTYVAKIQNSSEEGIDNSVARGDERKYRFEDQLLCLQLTPLCVGCTIGDSTLEAYFQVQFSQRLEISTMRSIYTLRDYVVKNRQIMDRSALQSVASICSLSGLQGVDPETERERAVLVFQSFIYVLKHFVLCAGSEMKQGGWGGEFRQSHHFTLLVAILDGLASLVRSHRITWRESVESLCLLTLAEELLDSPTFSSKVRLVVQALQLIKLSIENFMPPNLALLTNSMSGTSLDHLGPLIFKRLHDPNWEVRDSSLEVLLTLATISDTKYPLFQELIIDNKFCDVVVHLALNDAESYVCASATKCLTAMVPVDRLWNEELRDRDLVNKMIGILNGESEGVLRREASLLMSQIFKYRKVEPDVLKKMCVTMSNVVLSDLYWEVKVNGLYFWELIIEHQMNDQGMIDGSFPQVTFSKEHRKIIHLTPSAIQERLRKVLAELSQNGCLHVLLEAIRTDEDLEVVKKASQIILSLSVVLERHSLLDPKKPSTPTTIEGVSTSYQVCLPPVKSSEPSHPAFSNSLDKEMNSVMQRNCVPLNSECSTASNLSDCSETELGKSILDLDPQIMGFAALDDPELEPSLLASYDLQDKVIDSILNDRDINLLANVYLGTGAEIPGRQGPETKVTRPVRPLVTLSPEEFLHQLATLHVDKIVDERARWIADTGGNLDTLLDDMLINRNQELNLDVTDDFNAMDCY